MLEQEQTRILTKEVIDSLNMICLHEIGEEKVVYTIPTPSELNTSYLARLHINLPEVFVHKTRSVRKVKN